MSTAFDFEVPVVFFEKADEPQGRQRRIAGWITDEGRDLQGESVLQQGLDFDYFLKNGWFNDDHSKDHTMVVGYPSNLQFFTRGSVLPDGSMAEYDGYWVEGYLLRNYAPADRLWELGRSLQGTDRSLSFSVEGIIKKRTGPKTIRKTDPQGKPFYVGNRVAKAAVHNVAITTKPVNDRSKLILLEKSLTSTQEELDQEQPLMERIEAIAQMLDRVEKALTAGSPPDPGKHRVPEGPQTGEGAGGIVVDQDLEHDEKDLAKGVAPPPKVEEEPEEPEEEDDDEDTEDNLNKNLTEDEAISYVRDRYPQMTVDQARRLVHLATQNRE